MTWALRLKRVFAIDIEKCEKCGGPVRIIASIEDSDVIQKILQHRPFGFAVTITASTFKSISDTVDCTITVC